ncbi:RHS repeat-associated core domain-containing protein, partial [Burkholderia ubonensis]
YDALGRRIAKEVDGERTTFGWDGDRLAYESETQGSTHYVYEADSFVPLAQYASAPVAGIETPERTEADRYTPEEDPLQRVPERVGEAHAFYYHCDQIGTPLLMTDELGDVVWEASYKAWGEAREVIARASKAAGITPRNLLRFQGQQVDEETGLHYNRYRYYDPASGRFVSKDPIGLDGGINVYQYAPNPVQWVDPLGLSKRCPCDCPAGTIDPSQVHFMQSSAKNVTGDYTVLGNAQGLRDGTLDPNILKTKIWKDGTGKLWTLDHRRLAAFKLARKCMPYQMASQKEIDNQMWKMSTKNGGTSIRLKMEDGQSMTVE